MGTLTKFKGDTLKASKDIVPQMFVCWGAQTYKLLQNSVTLRGYILVKSSTNYVQTWHLY